MSTETSEAVLADVSTRSLAELIIKVITVHIITTANYMYASNLQGRKLKAGSSIWRVIFFIFAPSLCIAEIAFNLIRTVIRLAKDEPEDEDIDLWFFVCAAMGVHAVQRTSDEEETREHTPRSVPLLDVMRLRCEREKYEVTWTWAGQVFISLFTLAQGVGTIVVWVQRIIKNASFGLDDRNALMGIATTALSIQTLVILYPRIKWTVDDSASPAVADRTRTRSPPRLDRTYVRLACVAILLQATTRIDDLNHDRAFASPVMFFVWLVRFVAPHVSVWLYLLFGFVVYLLRREISEKFNLSDARRVLDRRLGLAGFVHGLLVLLIVVDVVFKLVRDLWVVVYERPASERGIWWEQTTLSDAIPVL